MDIYDVAGRLREAEGRMKKNITEFEAAQARTWAEKKEKIDERYSTEMEAYRKELASKTEARISSLKASLDKSIRKYKSSKSRQYLKKAGDTIAEVLEL
jgi:hypothetical protein